MGAGFKLAIALGTVTTGCLNSLFTKYQDNQCVRNCDSDVDRVNFEQPTLQTLQMFVGELSVFLVYQYVYRRRKDYQPIEPEDDLGWWESAKLAVPLLCDLCATTLLNIGLIYTPVSIYQMTRGLVVLFVAIMLVVFLKRRITKLEWLALIVVTVGVAIVGYSGSRTASAQLVEEESALVVFGIILIALAVAIMSIQFVFEEHLLSKRAISPLKLVYIEGFFGFSILLVAMIILNFVVGAIEPPKQFLHSAFNVREAFSQMYSSKEVLYSSVLIMVSIASFNFCGITLTQQLSATARSTIDTCRTLLVWLLAIIMGWEQFHFLQFFGFAVLVFGTLCFNGVLTPETWAWVPDSLKERPVHLLDTINEPLERQ